MRSVAAPHHASGVERVGAVRLGRPTRVEAEPLGRRRALRAHPPADPHPSNRSCIRVSRAAPYVASRPSLGPWPTTRSTRRRHPPAPVHRAAGRDDRAGRAARRVGARDPDQPFPLRDGHGDPELHPDGRAPGRAPRRPARSTSRSTAIYVTTLRRTHETAAPLARRLGLTPIEEPDLREVFLGEWEGGHLPARARSTTIPCSRRSSARSAGT